MKKVCVISNDFKDKDLVITKRITAFLNERGCETVVVMTKWDYETEKWTKPEGIPEDAECILVLGGDGTMLQAARHSYGMNIPLLGVNLGTLGFLTEVDSNYVEEALQQLLEGDYAIEERMMLEGTVITPEKEISSVALNDIVVNRTGSLQTVRFDIWLNNVLMKRYNADGCIVSTPTGSTGYNLSAGGPVVDPTSDAMVMTNICPHNFFNRGVVLAGNKLITIVIPGDRQGRNQQVEAAFDGSFKVKLNTGDCINITMAPCTTKIIRLEPISFMEILHKKMS
jgi:NAD+ kinase